MKNVSFFIILGMLLLSFPSIAQFSSCGGGGGFYSSFLTNPGALDGDDGNLDGNCEYKLTLSAFSANSPVLFVYLGNGTASQNSVPVTNTGGGTVTITGPCNGTIAEFDVMFSGSSECSIVNFNLPVELTSFTATPKDNGTYLRWETSAELNNEGFQVERSQDGQAWETLHFIPGNGDTDSPKSYSYIDIGPYQGVNYYRLKQMDFDGQVAYSPIINAYIEADFLGKELLVYPNPSTDAIQIITNISNPVQRMVLLDSNGKVLREWHDQPGRVFLNTYTNGLYYLQVFTPKKVFTQKVLKQ